MRQILDRQQATERGEFPITTIFPEGCTTNGSCIVKFKKGAFAALRPLKPIVFRYWNPSSISCTQDIAGFFFHSLVTMACIFITADIQYMPVFAPNDYFWEHHWEEGKEEKWEAFARVVREIMCEAGGYPSSELTMQDKFNYKAELKALHKNKHKAE